MKKVLLQNHPGSEKYSFNGWEIFNSNFERMIKENKAMLLCKWGFYLTCVVAVMFVFAAITSNGLWGSDQFWTECEQPGRTCKP